MILLIPLLFLKNVEISESNNEIMFVFFCLGYAFT